MLTFEQKLAVIESFPELTRKNVSLGRVNYHYEDSALDKKTVVYHLHPNGNGFVYAALTNSWKDELDDRGFVNIRHYDEAALRQLIAAALDSLRPEVDVTDLSDIQSTEPAASNPSEPGDIPNHDEATEHWHNAHGDLLTLLYEEDNDLWMVLVGDQLEDAFESRDEALEYLQAEGFSRR